MEREVPAMSHKRSVQAGVKAIRQLFGLYRDGKEMFGLFMLSPSAWQAYATRHQCEYKLWTVDEVDTLIQLGAHGWVQTLYRDVRFLVQRVDVARFLYSLQVRRALCRLGRLPQS